MQKFAQVAGWGKYIPEWTLTNDDLAHIVDTSDEWITSHTGIRERRVACTDDTVASMSVEASRIALKRAHLSGADLDLIIMATSSPDFQLPGAAGIVQDRLGAHRAAAFDLRSGCSGFVYGLAVANQFIANGMYKRVLVVGAEIITRFVDWSDRRTCVLFGDGAGAAVLEATDVPTGVLRVQLGCKGSGHDALYVAGGGSVHPMCPETWTRGWHYIRMDGQRVARFAVRAVLRGTKDVLRESGLTWSDIDLFIPHQSNLRLIEYVAKKLHIPWDKIFVNVDRYANMSTASIPVALCEAAEQGRLQEGDNVLLMAYGAGLTWAAAVIQWGVARKKKARLVAWRFVPLDADVFSGLVNRARTTVQAVSSTVAASLVPLLSSIKRRKD